MSEGTIARLLKEKGFGFIRDDGGSEWFFHRSSVRGGQFEMMREGDRVEYREGAGAKGPRAEDVRPV